MMYRKKDSSLWGLKFIDNKRNSLLATGLIDRPIYRKDKETWAIKEIRLQEGERLVGIKF